MNSTILENSKLLLQLYYSPLSTLNKIIDYGSWIYAGVLVILISILLQFGITSAIYEKYEWTTHNLETVKNIPIPPSEILNPQNDPSEEDILENGDEAYYEINPTIHKQSFYSRFVSFSKESTYGTLPIIVLLGVPFIILLIIFLEPLGSFRVALERYYGSFLVCTLMSWIAAYLPVALLGLIAVTIHLGAKTALILWIAGTLYFSFLMINTTRIVFGIKYNKAIVTTLFFWIPIRTGLFFVNLIQPLIFSFYLWIWIIPAGLALFKVLSSSHRATQRFHHNLTALTINPKDADAHYQLGLIYQHRHQYDEAISRFNKAIEIDSRELDAYFQLGRIAREQGRLQDAIDNFNEIVIQDDKHSQNEIWREIGVAYLSAKMFDEAHKALELYLSRRPYDPEGLYYFGETLISLDRKDFAKEIFIQCIDAVKTMPYYRRGQLNKWRKLAQKQLNLL